MFSLGTRFGGVVVKDENEIALANIEDFVTHQELQRFENERFGAELAAERAKRPPGRPSKATSLITDSERSISKSSATISRLSSPKPRGRPRKVIASNSAPSPLFKPKGPRGRPKKVVPAVLQAPTHSITVEIPSPMKAKIDTFRATLQSTISPVSDPNVLASKDDFRDELADSEELSQSSKISRTLKPTSSTLLMAGRSPKPSAGPLQTTSLRQMTFSSPQPRTINQGQPISHPASPPNPQPLMRSPASQHQGFLPIRTSTHAIPRSTKKQSSPAHYPREIQMPETNRREDLEIPPHVQDELVKSLFPEDLIASSPAVESSLPHDLQPHPHVISSPAEDLNSELDPDTEQDAICLLRQFQCPISASCHQIPNHHLPAISPRKTPTMQDSPKTHGRLSMTPHYPSRRSIAEVLGKRNRADEGSGRVGERKRKRGMEGKAVVKGSEGGREESIEL